MATASAGAQSFARPVVPIAESLAAGLAHSRQLWFGTERNVGHLLAHAADELGVVVHVTTA
ncbi:MAG: hypothetical protein ACYCST_02530 [Acidimicrobiales bacterium]